MSDTSPAKLHKDLVDAACCLMEQVHGTEHSILEALPGGNRLSIEIAILPPMEDSDEGAMRTEATMERPVS
jgi:hypothetical protein